MAQSLDTTPQQQAEERRTGELLRRLEDAYPDARCSLTFSTPLELLVATILSAQCTDERVNIVTPTLFATYPTAAAFASAPLEELEGAIHSTGFYRNKARNIQAACRRIVDVYDGEVPATMADLLTLPGVARKTANVVLGNAFAHPEGIAVDTHVARLSQRLGLTLHKDPVKIEMDLLARLPRSHWVSFNHQLIYHGRATCTAQRPRCTACTLADLCPSAGGIA
ncbi:MAG: endonuclease III [Chloroflexota bacterium]